MATLFYPRTTTSDLVGYEASLTAGSSMDSATATTTASPPDQMNYGGSATVWWSKPLSAVTISSAPTINIRAKESNGKANATVRMKIDWCNGTGAVQGNILDSSFGTELGTSDAARQWSPSATSRTLSDGHRLKFTMYDDQATGVTIAAGYTVTITFNGSGGVAGDTYVSFVETITEYSTTSISSVLGVANASISSIQGFPRALVASVLGQT